MVTDDQFQAAAEEATRRHKNEQGRLELIRLEEDVMLNREQTIKEFQEAMLNRQKETAEADRNHLLLIWDTFGFPPAKKN